MDSMFDTQTAKARQDIEAPTSAEEPKKRALEDDVAAKTRTAKVAKTLTGEDKLDAHLDAALATRRTAQRTVTEIAQPAA